MKANKVVQQSWGGCTRHCALFNQTSCVLVAANGQHALLACICGLSALAAPCLRAQGCYEEGRNRGHVLSCKLRENRPAKQ